MLPEFLRGGTSHSNLCTCEKAGKANVAQLVEQLIRNEQVSGSSPLIGSGKTVSIEVYLTNTEAVFVWCACANFAG